MHGRFIKCTSKMKSVATILTVFNRKEATLRCLRSLKAQSMTDDITLHIYLTNDGCTDGTPEALRKEFPDVKIIEGDGTLFWNRGMYTAWEAAAKQADYDFYLWLNDDCLVYPQMVSRLLEASTSKDDKAIIVGATQSHDHHQQTYGGRLQKGNFPEMDGTLVRVDYFNGNIVLVPRTVYQKLGNLDYYFTHSFGDFDYGRRAKKAGFEIFQVGEFLGECDKHPTLDKWCNPEVPILQRWKMLWRPNGMPPHEVFHFEKRHLSLPTASFHYCTTILHCCLPCLWMNKKRK